MAIRASNAFRITFDYNRVKYSALTEDMVSNFQEPNPVALAALSIDDGDEFRLGFEYTFIQLTHPVALRFGSWQSPDHKIFFGAEAYQSHR